MWLVMGFGAIIFAILNLVWTSKQKNSKWFGFISLSLTALTACSFYSDAAVQVAAEDWGGSYGYTAFYEQNVMDLRHPIYFGKFYHAFGR